MLFNREGFAAYPEKIKKLPYCNWRYEKRNGQKTKVPYNPLTGSRASVDKPESFADCEAAIRELYHFSGIGIKVDGTVGCVDIDHCVNEDGSLTKTGEDILELLANAFVELSPSGTGLHMYFNLPDGFVFDRKAYYINNRKTGTEIYIPGCTNRFLTVTGDVYRDGDLSVTTEQLMKFLDTYMKRPEVSEKYAECPGKAVLTDSEVVYKATKSPSGEKFASLYEGNWQEVDGIDSQSEADMSLCGILAFWCCGDIEQMNRIFKSSGLYREKWNRAQSGSTYGLITMKNAVNGCRAFYEPEHHSSAEEDFKTVDEYEKVLSGTEPVNYTSSNTPDTMTAAPDNIIEDSDNTTDDSDNMDDVNAHIKIIDTYLSETPSIDQALSEAFLTEVAWAYQNDMARYVKLKGVVPKEIGIRNFEREVKRQMMEMKREEMPAATFLSLSGISKTSSGITVSRYLVPENWIVDDTGICHIEMVFGEYKPVRITSEPLFVSAKLVNVDDGTEKLEVTFRRNGKYKTLVAPRADMLNKNAIIKYADEGFPVSSNTAGTITRYIAEVESVNNRIIPIKRSIRRAGWIGEEFYPYSLKNGIVAQSDGNETERILAALKTGGSEDEWMDIAMKARTMPFARSMLAASFASPLLEKLQHRVIYYHIWYGSRSGKTAALKLATSVWGDPKVLMSKYFSTIVGMERWAGTLKHLPFAMDELQTLNQKRLSVNDIVYTLGNGSGKTRGRIGSGLQKVEEWRNCILSTGEQPMSNENSMDGVNTRLMEIYACPLSKDGTGTPDDELAMELHKVCEQNYGFAGEKFIRWIVERMSSCDSGCSGYSGDKKEKNIIKYDYNRIFTEFRKFHNVQAGNVAVLALADYYSSMAVFGMHEERAFEEAVTLGHTVLHSIEENAPKDSVESAWDFVCGWIASNKTHFVGNGSLYEKTPLLGTIEKEHIYVIANELNNALDAAGYSHRKCIKGFQERGYIESFSDSQGKKRSQMGKRVNGILSRVYILNIGGIGEKEELPAFADESTSA